MAVIIGFDVAPGATIALAMIRDMQSSEGSGIRCHLFRLQPIAGKWSHQISLNTFEVLVWSCLLAQLPLVRGPNTRVAACVWCHWYQPEQLLKWYLCFHSKKPFASLPEPPETWPPQCVPSCDESSFSSGCVCTKIALFPSQLPGACEMGALWDLWGEVTTSLPMKLWLDPQVWSRWDPTQFELSPPGTFECWDNFQ